MSLHTKIIISTLTIISSLILTTSASALGYQSDPITLDFTFGSTLSITTDGNITIPNLTPGTVALSSNSYTVAVATNSIAGYTLTATVGCETGANCNNTKSLKSGDNTFSMVSSTTGVALDSGEWGYTTANPSSATASVFKTLALYSETTPTTINKTKDANGTAYDSNYLGGNSTVFQIGAKATNSQEAGTYTNVINFLAVANPIPTYTVTLATSNATNIIIDGISYINGDTPTLVQGTHTISGTYPVGFTSWSSTGGVAVANTSSETTTITVDGTGTLTLTGKEEPKQYYDVTVQIGGRTDSVVFSNETYGSVSIVKSVDGTEKVLSFAEGVIYNYTAKASRSNNEDFSVNISGDITNLGETQTCDNYSTYNGTIQINGPGTISMNHYQAPC